MRKILQTSLNKAPNKSGKKGMKRKYPSPSKPKKQNPKHIFKG
jgi:hypothetical protein